MEINVEQLAEFLADRMTPAIPVDVAFWSKKEIGGCLGLGTTSIDSLVKRPDFPASYRFPTKNGSQPRWKAKDVLAWAEKFHGRGRKNVCRHTVSRWKTPERSFLLRNHGKKTVQEIAEFIGRTPDQVRNRINYEKKLGTLSGPALQSMY